RSKIASQIYGSSLDGEGGVSSSRPRNARRKPRHRRRARYRTAWERRCPAGQKNPRSCKFFDQIAVLPTGEHQSVVHFRTLPPTRKGRSALAGAEQAPFMECSYETSTDEGDGPLGDTSPGCRRADHCPGGGRC